MSLASTDPTGLVVHPALEAAGVDLLLFDMDGVLVDVRDSYRQAIARTVEIYVRDVARLGDSAAAPLTPDLLAAWKNAGGFNNDWDLSAALAGAVICGGGRDLKHLAEDVAAAGGGLAGLEGVLGRVATAAVRYTGDIGDPYDIKRIFQELYLGGGRFRQTAGLLPVHVGMETEGLCDHETAILSPAVCRALAGWRPLAVATGRPEAEARHALQRLGTLEAFQALVTDDDVRAETRRSGRPPAEVSKPSPWSLIEAARKAGHPQGRAAYVGDLADDMAAARAAGMLAIGVGVPAPAGAEVELAHPDELIRASP